MTSTTDQTVTSDATDNAPQYVPAVVVVANDAPVNMEAGSLNAELAKGDEKVKPSEKFPNVARLFSIADIAKLAGMAGQTVATYVMTEVAPKPDYLVGERMVWTSLDPWQTWLDDRKAKAAAKEAERIAQESADFAKMAGKIAARSDSIDPAARSTLLTALLAKMSPEEISALVSAPLTDADHT